MPTDDRCGYRLQIGLGDDFDGDPCERPVWDDHDHCVWGAEVGGKTIGRCEDGRPVRGEVLDGA
jgi:hypothetical protein